MHRKLLLCQDALCNLYIKKIVRHLKVRHRPVHHFKNITQRKIHAGQIDGDGDNGFTGINGGTNTTADLPDHMAVKPVDKLFALQHRDKLHRLDHTVLGIDPARQRLKAAQLPGDRTDHRLIIDLNKAFGESLIKAFKNIGIQALFHRFSFQTDGRNTRL